MKLILYINGKYLIEEEVKLPDLSIRPLRYREVQYEEIVKKRVEEMKLRYNQIMLKYAWEIVLVAESKIHLVDEDEEIILPTVPRKRRIREPYRFNKFH